MPEARDLVRRARQLLPSIGEVEPEAVRIAIRPIPGDHLSAIGPMPRTSGYYIAVTHSGVTMSPFLGMAVADEIVRGRKGANSPISGPRVSLTDLETKPPNAFDHAGNASRAANTSHFWRRSRIETEHVALRCRRLAAPRHMIKPEQM